METEHEWRHKFGPLWQTHINGLSVLKEEGKDERLGLYYLGGSKYEVMDSFGEIHHFDTFKEVEEFCNS